MALFESISKKVGEAAQATAKKSSEMIETAKINSAIGTEEDKIKKAYTQLGQSLYDNRNSTPLDYTDIFNSIDNSKKTIEDLRAKILEVKNVKVCISCGNQMPRTSSFCNKCGAKNENTPTKICECGADISQSEGFCGSCGKR